MSNNAIAGCGMKELPLRNRSNQIVAYTQVDDDMFDYLMQWQWRLGSRGYAERTAYSKGEKKKIRLHCIVIDVPAGMLTDHIDRNRLNNQRSNLRAVTQAQNNRNVSLRKNKKSAYRGVCRGKTGWEARFHFDHKTMQIGTFKSEIDAAKAYDQTATRYLGEAALLNFPD